MYWRFTSRISAAITSAWFGSCGCANWKRSVRTRCPRGTGRRRTWSRKIRASGSTSNRARGTRSIWGMTENPTILPAPSRAAQNASGRRRHHSSRIATDSGGSAATAMSCSAAQWAPGGGGAGPAGLRMEADEIELGELCGDGGDGCRVVVEGGAGDEGGGGEPKRQRMAARQPMDAIDVIARDAFLDEQRLGVVAGQV